MSAHGRLRPCNGPDLISARERHLMQQALEAGRAGYVSVEVWLAEPISDCHIVEQMVHHEAEEHAHRTSCTCGSKSDRMTDHKTNCPRYVGN